MRIWHVLLAGSVFLATLALAPAPAHAARSYDSCTGFIDSLPAVISVQGVWCLRKDLSTAMASGNAIDIQANNVTIDCGDFKLGGLAAGAATQTSGIYANSRFNLTVRNCSIRGFWYGIFFRGWGGGGHLIEDNRLDSNLHTGIYVWGDGSTVRHNGIHNTGGYNADPLTRSAIGIATVYDVDVLDNTINGLKPTADGEASAYGIYTAFQSNGSINHNRVRGLVPHLSGKAYGIYAGGPGRITMRDNELVGPGDVGLHCLDDGAHAKGNIINGFTTAISTCGADSNVVAP